MRIAFCDDDIIFSSKYDQYISRLSDSLPYLDYDNFEDGESLVLQYEKEDKPYDMIFLDIEMKQLNGLETAQKIRRYDESVLIIYVTNHTEYVYQSFEVSPFRFLVKPIQFEAFREILFACYKKIQDNKNTVYFTVDRKIVRLYCSDIYYIESQKRILIIHTANGDFKTYDKINRLEAELYGNDFIPVHKSYLVNMNHIFEISTESLKLRNGDIIPISENRRRYVKEEHMKFILRGYHI